MNKKSESNVFIYGILALFICVAMFGAMQIANGGVRGAGPVRTASGDSASEKETSAPPSQSRAGSESEAELDADAAKAIQGYPAGYFSDLDELAYQDINVHFLAIYGMLLDEGPWETVTDLSPDVLFRFYLQERYHMFFTRLDYSEIYGNAFDRQMIPDVYSTMDDGNIIFPQSEVEQVLQQYFDVSQDYLRQASVYLPELEGYRLTYYSLGDEVLPVVSNYLVSKDGDSATIEFHLFGVAENGELDKEDWRATYEMEVHIQEDTFHYRSLKRLTYLSADRSLIYRYI